MKIANKSVVGIDYTLKNEAGQVLDSSQGGDPLYYLHGYGNIIPGLEEALTDKSAGDSIQVTIPPERLTVYVMKKPLYRYTAISLTALLKLQRVWKYRHKANRVFKYLPLPRSWEILSFWTEIILWPVKPCTLM